MERKQERATRGVLLWLVFATFLAAPQPCTAEETIRLSNIAPYIVMLVLKVLSVECLCQKVTV